MWPPQSGKRPSNKASELAEGWERGRHRTAQVRGLSGDQSPFPSPSGSCQASSLSGRPRARWSCWASRAPWTAWGPGPSRGHRERWPQGSARPSGKLDYPEPGPAPTRTPNPDPEVKRTPSPIPSSDSNPTLTAPPTQTLKPNLTGCLDPVKTLTPNSFPNPDPHRNQLLSDSHAHP